MERSVGGLVVTEESVTDESALDVGDTIVVNEVEHVVLNKRGTYDVSRDKWEVTLKLAKLGECKVHEQDDIETPEWVTNTVHGEH